MKKNNRIYLFGLLATMSCAAQAVEFSVSGFGTIGYAQSNQAESYQRHINSTGNFRRDTLLGAQLDTQFNSKWSATLQAKLATAPNTDQGVQAAVSWAFLSYRPTDDLLFRAGKLRIPFYLNSENADIGTSFAAARLPVEVYATAPTMDFQGLAFAKTWLVGENELTLDSYWGKANASWRFYARDPNNLLTPTGASGEFLMPLATTAKGLRLSLQQDENTYQAGIHFTSTVARSGNLGPSTYVPGPSLLGFGLAGTYYMPSPNTQFKVDATIVNFGMSTDLGHGFRTTNEYVRRKNPSSELGPDSESFYLMLQNKLGKWTPYVSYAQITTKNRALYQAVNNAKVQALAPIPVLAAQAAQINASQRMLADTMIAYDQYTWALGTAYTIDYDSKIKAEWSVTQSGIGSSFIDAPPAGESGNKRISVITLSYHFTF